jgi:hypothetical protein
LGIPPSIAKVTPICEIYLMLDGHMDYLKMTSPLRGGPAMVDQKPKTADDVADNVRSVLGGLANG